MKLSAIALMTLLSLQVLAQKDYMEYAPKEYIYDHDFQTARSFSFETWNGYHDRGYMILERSDERVSGYSMVKEIDLERDWELEARIKILNAERKTDALGFMIGDYSSNWNLHRFNFDAEGKHQIKTSINGNFEDLFPLMVIGKNYPGAFNTYTVRKVKDKVYCFVNGHLISETKIKDWLGNEVRLRVSGGIRQQVDYVYAAYIDKGTRETKTFNDQSVRSQADIYNAYVPFESLFEDKMNSDENWAKGDNLFVDRGELMLQVTNSTYEYKRGLTLPKEDFQIEADIRRLNDQGEINHGIRLYQSFKDWDNNSGYYFLLWPKINDYRVTTFTEVAGEINYESQGQENLISISDNQFNKLTIRRHGDTVSVFVNQMQAMSFIEKEAFIDFSIRGEFKSTSAFDNIKVSKIKLKSQASSEDIVAAAKSNSTSTYRYHTGPFKNQFPLPLIATDHEEYKRAKEAYEKGNYELSQNLMKELVMYYPESADIYLYLGLNELQFRNYDEGYRYIKTANLMNPSDIPTILNTIVFSALTQKTSEANAHAKTLAKMVNKEWFDLNVKYMDAYANSFASYAPQGANILRNTISLYKQEYQRASHQYYETVENSVFYQIDKYPRRYAAEIIPRLNKATRLIMDEGLPYSIQHAMLLEINNVLVRERDNTENSEDWQGWFDKRAFDIGNAIWRTFESGELENDYQEVKFSEMKYNSMVNTGDLENALALNGIRIEKVRNNPLLTYTWNYLIAQRMMVLSGMNRREEARDLEKFVLEGLKKYRNPEYQIIANNAIGLANRYFDGEKSLKYSLATEKVITSTGFNEGISSTYNRISIAYFDLKQDEKGIEYALKAAEAVEDEISKAVNYTSLGVAYRRKGDMEKSVEMYEKAEGLYIEAIKTRSEYRANRAYQLLYQNNISLALDLIKANKTKQAFEVIERANSLRLAKKLTVNDEVKSVSLEEIQALLSPDQAILYYSSDPVNEFYYINFLITKDGIQSHSIRELEALFNIRNKYADSLAVIEKQFAMNEMRKANFEYDADIMQPGDFNLLTEHLRKSFKANDYRAIAEVGGAYYDIFIKPFESQFKSKKELLIVPSATLSFVPFEGLLTSEAKMMVELYDINYVQSPTIWKTLQERNYGQRPKTILAMGGANYAEPNIQANIIKSFADVDRIKYEVFDGIMDSVKTFRQQWADLGHLPHKYLPGTKAEVEAIKKLVPSTDLLIGDEMSESKIKSMSANGSLDDYQVLHFATHGWVENFVSPLSGLTMSVFPDEQNGEDGHIYLHEASQLKLKADLVMLSACQTGLGKAEVGQGVAGLNQAFLTAGANSTVVSLWSVNDYATSLLASEMYRLRFKEGMSFSKALNQVKRNFIQGVYNQQNIKLDKPEYWAPFVYYGKTE